MRGLADPDSRIYSVLNKLVLLMELNLLLVLACVPVVTVGAALSAMHGVMLKIYREEEKQVPADFWQALKANLKKGTGLWLLYLGFLAVLAGLGFAARGQVYVVYGLLLAAVLGLLYLDWALILLSRYEYTLRECLKYALLAWLQYPGSTVVYLVSIVIPGLFCLTLETMPLILLGGITLPHFISTTLYSPVFDKLEGLPPRMPKL